MTSLNNGKTHFIVIASKSQHKRNETFGITLNTGFKIITPSEDDSIFGHCRQKYLLWNNPIINNLSRKIDALGKICTQADCRVRKMLAKDLVM